MKTLILGIGNLLWGDEGVGVHAARELLGAELPEDTKVLEVGTSILDALGELENSERLIVLDAIKAEGIPGTVYRLHIDNCESPNDIASMHGFDVFALLALTLPSIIGFLSFTGRLILPYQVIAYVQGLWNWTSMVLSALSDAAWVLIRYGVTKPAGLACLGSGAAMGVLAIFAMRHLLSRRIAQG